ncbi:MAG: hypothetical protein ABI967_07615 [bacterium]
MKRKIFTGAIFALALVALFLSTTPTQAVSTFLIGPKPEKKWMEYFYRANGVAPAPKPSTLMLNGTAVGFDFPDTPDVSGFNTKHPAYNGTLLGDLTGKTVSASITVSGVTGPFIYYGQGTASNPCGTPANVRLYFETNSNELGESQYWWSNPVSYPLANGPATLTSTLNPANWSDRDGHFGTFDAAHTAAFAASVADVQQIGLSFGGGCFFANGVGTSDGSGTFTLTNFIVTP